MNRTYLTGGRLRIVSFATVIAVVCAAALFVALLQRDRDARNRRVGAALAPPASGDIRHGAPPLPEELAETTRFVKASRQEDGALTYRYEVTGPDLDAGRIQAFVNETLTEQLYLEWCADERLSYNSMDTWYEYVDPQGTELADLLVIASKSSCRKWWRLEKERAKQDAN